MIPPKNETIWVQYLIDGVCKYAVTSTQIRDIYHLCEIKNNKCIKTKHKSKDPTTFEKIIFSDNF